jgi:hypothetical protein
VVLVGLACVAFAFVGRGSFDRLGSASDWLDAGFPVFGDGFGFWRSFGFAFVFGGSGEFVPCRRDVFAARDGGGFGVFDDGRRDGCRFGCVGLVSDVGFSSCGAESFRGDGFGDSDGDRSLVVRAYGERRSWRDWFPDVLWFCFGVDRVVGRNVGVRNRRNCLFGDASCGYSFRRRDVVVCAWGRLDASFGDELLFLDEGFVGDSDGFGDVVSVLRRDWFSWWFRLVRVLGDDRSRDPFLVRCDFGRRDAGPGLFGDASVGELLGRWRDAFVFGDDVGSVRAFSILGRGCFRDSECVWNCFVYGSRDGFSWWNG